MRATFHQGNPPLFSWQWRYVPVGGGQVGAAWPLPSCRVGLRWTWTWTCDALPARAWQLQTSNSPISNNLTGSLSQYLPDHTYTIATTQ